MEYVPGTARGSLRVLIVDDDELSCTVCTQVLRKAGYDAAFATDGQRALETLASSHYDLVVADVLMPHMSGFELVRTMRTDERLTRLPVLFLTACQEDDMLSRGYRAGCDSYLVKPVRPPDLLEEVESLLVRAAGTSSQLSGSYLSGRLDGVPVGSLLEFLHEQQRSGILRLSRFGANGEITIRRGELLTARVGRKVFGEEALSALLGWNAGTFRFERFDVSEIDPRLPGPFIELIRRVECSRDSV